MTGKVDPWARWAGAALVTGPVVFVVAMGVEQALRPGFSDFTNTISDLGVDINGWSYSWMFTASILLLGVLTLFAAYGLIMVFGRPAWVGAILLGLAGIGAIGVGIFNEDAHPVEHSVFALLAFLMSGLAVLLLAPVLAKDPRWGPPYALLSRLCGIVDLVSLVVFIALPGSSDVRGLAERFIVAPVLLWAVVAGWRMLNLPPSAGSGVDAWTPSATPPP